MFKFKGKKSTTMGVIAEEEDFFIKAPIKYTEYEINGRNGSIFAETGYGNVASSFNLSILTSDIDAILDWLNGPGQFEYKNRITTMRFYDAIEVKRLGNVHTISVNYIRSPFWYNANDMPILVKDFVRNNGNVNAHPIIKIFPKKIGIFEMKINSVTFTYNFDSLEPLIVNCNDKTEMVNGISKSPNMQIGYEYPILAPGVNKLEAKGIAADIYISRKDCWR